MYVLLLLLQALALRRVLPLCLCTWQGAA